MSCLVKQLLFGIYGQVVFHGTMSNPLFTRNNLWPSGDLVSTPTVFQFKIILKHSQKLKNTKKTDEELNEHKQHVK